MSLALLLVAVPGAWTVVEAGSAVAEGLLENPDPQDSADLPVPDLVMGYLDRALPGGLLDLGAAGEGYAHLSAPDVQALSRALAAVPGIPQVDDAVALEAFGGALADHEREVLADQLIELHRLLATAAATERGLVVGIQ